MKENTVNRLAWIALYLTVLPLAMFLVGFGDMYFDQGGPGGEVPSAPADIGAIYADIFFWVAILDIAGLLAITPLLLAGVALWKRCARKWPAILALLVNGLVLAMWAQMYFMTT